MGILWDRIVEKMFYEFVCMICFDVVANPVLANDCEHMFCHECIQSDHLDSKKCPKCFESLKQPKWKTLKGALKRCYECLQIKCLNPSCKRMFNVYSFADHDQNCELKYPCCNYSKKPGQIDLTVNGKPMRHISFCKVALKPFYDAKLVQVERELDRLLGQREKKSQERMTKGIKQTLKMMDDRIRALRGMMVLFRHQSYLADPGDPQITVIRNEPAPDFTDLVRSITEKSKLEYVEPSEQLVAVQGKKKRRRKRSKKPSRNTK